MRSILTCSVLLLFLSGQWSVVAQSALLEKISIERGLSQGFITAICEDKNGLLWFGTGAGLNRFDGYRFYIYKSDPSDSFALSNDHVAALAATPDFLLVSTLESVSLLHLKTKRFYRLPHPQLKVRSRNSKLLAEPDGRRIWLSFYNSSSSSLYQLNLAPDLEQKLTQSDNIEKTLLENIRVEYRAAYGTEMCLSGDKSTLYAIDRSGALYRHNLHSGIKDSLHIPEFSNDVFYIFPGVGNDVWMNRRGKYLLNYQPDQPPEARFRKYAVESNLQVALFDHEHRSIWLSNDQHLCRFNITQLPASLNEGNSVQKLVANILIRFGLIDHNGIIWFNTDAQGLYKYNPQTQTFSNYLQGKSVYGPPYADKKGNIWIGRFAIVDNNYRVDRATGKAVQYIPPGWKNDWLYAQVCGNAWGDIWQVLPNRKKPELLIRFLPDGDSTRAEQVFLPIQPCEAHFSIQSIGNDAVLIAFSNQVYLYNRLIKHTQVFDLTYLGLGCQTINATAVTADNVLWMASAEGLLKVPLATDAKFAAKLLKSNPNVSNSLSGNSLKSLYIDPSDPQVLWIGYSGRGLSRYHIGKETFEHFSTKNGLPDDVVYGILPELSAYKQGNAVLWLSTNRGLARFDYTNNTFRYFSKSNGLQETEFNTSAYGITPDSALMFGGINGLSVFHPEKITTNTRIPKVLITGIRVNGEYITPHKNPDVLQYSIEYSPRISLSHKQNNLVIEFMSNDLTKPERNQFTYYLEGAEQAWQHRSLEPSAQYLNLTAGTYHFKILGSNSDGVWSTEPCTIEITIRPPWWASLWAILFYLFLGGTIAYRGYLFLDSRRRARAENQRLKELDDVKNRLYTNVTHEFRTPLTVMLGMGDLMQQDLALLKDHNTKQVLADKLQLIRNNGQHMLQLINQMLELARLESGYQALKPVACDAVAFARMNTESFRTYAQAKGITLYFESQMSQFHLHCDVEKVQAIIGNLLANAIKYTPAGGSIKVSLEYREQQGISLHVSDTGPGVPTEMQEKIFERFYRSGNNGESTGVGLALARELARLMGGDIYVNSSPGAGATFSLMLPYTVQTSAVGIQEKNDDGAVQIHTGNKGPDSPLILLIDDNPDIMQYLSACLSQQYQLLQADNGESGVALALEHSPDLIISDVMMPGMDGFTLCETLKNDERSSHILIILLTAKSTDQDRIDGLRRGADAYLSKPFNREELMVVIEKLLENRRRFQAYYSGKSSDSSPATEASHPIEDAFLRKLREVVEANLSDSEFDMQQLSRAIGMSHSQIFRKLKALTAQSPSVFIRNTRLARARHLLETSDMTAAEIAYATGFASPAHFSTVFLEMYGQTPGSVREKLLK
ncbi:MAG: response regulator [Chitinophagales bacterium]|nr:response regulator [Chitinophagales bacterium]